MPKDGPSAGVTLTTALVSCLSGIPVRGDVAMTGEITLHGNVLPIGGLREKSMAAYREGMKTVLIPKDNEPDLYEVDDEVKKNLTFLPMQSLTQVLNAALLKPNAAKSAAGRTHTKKKAAEKHIPAAAEKPQPGAAVLRTIETSQSRLRRASSPEGGSLRDVFHQMKELPLRGSWRGTK